MVQSYNFYEFLKDATNQSLVFLQDNPQYDDVLRALADMFDKIYLRVQEIKVTNTYDIDGDSSFQDYLNTNDGAVDIDFLLEQSALYLDTDHFKDTIALLIRQFRERELGTEIPNVEEFIRDEIIPSYKFFTMNAGDLHKSKGVKSLIERIFEFYSPASTYEKMFDGVLEYDTSDSEGRRLERFSSYRVGISEEVLLNNYDALSNKTIKDYFELDTHKITQAGKYVFISRKDRDDWYLIDSNVTSIHKIDDNYYALRQDTVLSFYKDATDLYNANYEYVTPTPETTYEDVKFIPKVINVRDPLDEYHNHNLYFVEKIENPDTFADFEYNLIRFQHDVSRDRTIFQTIRRGMGISYDELSYNSRTAYPRIDKYVSLDYIWIDLYAEDATTYNFDKEDTKLVYSYVVDYQTKQPDGLGGFVYPINKVLIVARDGYNYEPETNGFYYNIIEKLTNNNYDKYVLQERVLTSLQKEEMNKSVSADWGDVKTVFDIMSLEKSTIWEDNYYTFKGYWDASGGSEPAAPQGYNHGDYWKVSVAGTTPLNGVSIWTVDDVLVWNGNFNYWEKNNEIPSLTNTSSNHYYIDRTMLIMNTPEFDYVDADDNSMITPYEKSGGMFQFKLSNIVLDINAFTDVYSVDSNSIETFGSDPVVLYTFKSNIDNRIKIMSVKMDEFTPETDIADLSRILRSYPYQNSKIVVRSVDFTDKHIIVYASDSKNSGIGSMAIIMENTGYNLPLGIRTNDMNIQYDVDLRNVTREYQPYYRINDDDGVEIIDEEVSAFKATLERYTPINTNSDNLAAKIDMGYTNQKIEAGSEPDVLTVEFPVTGAEKTLKEQSILKMQDNLFMRIDGSPGDVNCDCNRQRDILYVYDFEAMTIFYDVVNRIPDPNLIGVPTKVAVNNVERTRDRFSGYQDVCRWNCDWFEYYYDEGNTIPMRVRTKIRINLYDRFQQFVPWGSNGILRYNWGIHFHVQYLQDDIESTISNWVDAIDEEVYKQVVEYDECNPIGQFYTTDLIDDGSTFPMVIVDDGSTVPTLVPAESKEPWEVYDVPAAKISLT